MEKAKDVRCKVVYVESQGSWIDGDTAEYGVGPYEFWSRIDVKDWMKEIIHKFLGARNWQRPIVSVHIRTFLEVAAHSLMSSQCLGVRDSPAAFKGGGTKEEVI